MKYLRSLVPLTLLSVLVTCAVAMAEFSGGASHDGNPYSNPYSSPSNSYGRSRDASSHYSPSSPPYSTPYGQQHQPQRSEPWTPLPPVTHDFNVWKDGKPTLCTATKQDVYCY